MSQAWGRRVPDTPFLGDLERRFINRYQGGFPLLKRPYAAAAAELGTDEETLIDLVRGLLDTGLLSRFGPLFDAERLGGRFTLAAMAVPEAAFDRVAARLAALPEVAHNYRRDHVLNMWFVLATPSEQGLRETLGMIRDLTGLEVLDFPKLAEYHLGFWLHLDAAGGLGMRRWERMAEAGQDHLDLGALSSDNLPSSSTLAEDEGGEGRAGDQPEASATDKDDPLDLALVTATQGGLPLVAEPYAAIARELGVSSARVRQGLATMLDRGAIRRIGAVPNHYRLGLRGNGMTVWDIEDEAVDRLGAAIAALEGVSHCYRRPRRPPLWPYNLFAMLHGRDRDEVRAAAARVAALVASHCRGHDILFSQAVLKKTGLRFTDARQASPDIASHPSPQDRPRCSA
jgi:DNA-binding Lrp family transcriptional regulator